MPANVGNWPDHCLMQKASTARYLHGRDRRHATLLRPAPHDKLTFRSRVDTLLCGDPGMPSIARSTDALGRAYRFWPTVVSLVCIYVSFL